MILIPRLNIARKMLLGYLAIVALMFLIAAFAISSLQRLNSLNRIIVETDVPLVETAERMIDTLISEEFYARRYVILNSPEMLALFRDKGKEFVGLVEKTRSLRGAKDIPADRFTSLHSDYCNLLSELTTQFGQPSSPAARKTDLAVKKKQGELIELIKDTSARARRDQIEKNMLTSRIGTAAVRIMLMLCFLSIIVSVVLTVLLTTNIARPISRLELATRRISEGKFDLVEVKNRDELGDLANAFNEMTKRLRKLEEMCLDASPLTRLPGNIAIENVLTKRIEGGAPLAFCYIDLDDFKAFNDRYGYAKGSEVIAATGMIIEKCVKEAGTQDDFVGHIGGDDFVLITTPSNFRKTCDRIIDAFDKAIPAFYAADYRARGFITGKTRGGQEWKFPIMSLSIAVVSNVERRLTSPIQVGEIAAELKAYAKSIPGSVYVLDKRRKNPLEGTDEPITSVNEGYDL